MKKSILRMDLKYTMLRDKRSVHSVNKARKKFNEAIGNNATEVL